MLTNLSETETLTATDLLNIFQDIYKNLDTPTFRLDDLKNYLNAKQTRLVSKLLDNHTVELTTQEIRKLITPVDDSYSKSFVRVEAELYKSFKELNIALNLATGESLYIMSGYRSPAYQAFIFLKQLYFDGFITDKTVKQVKYPVDSEHCHYPRHAIDIATMDNKKISPSFSKTKAYKWLVASCAEYGFKLSYPTGNQKNTRFEPWHWLYVSP